MYSSKLETKEHILNVNTAINRLCSLLLDRGRMHDESKLLPPELEHFDKYTPLLKVIEYGTKDYQEALDALKPALKNHYKHNRHHPEHFSSGVNGMNLVDIIEMYCDWWAASKRTANGSFGKSIEIGCDRFKMSPQLKQIFLNTKSSYLFFEVGTK